MHAIMFSDTIVTSPPPSVNRSKGLAALPPSADRDRLRVVREIGCQTGQRLAVRKS